MASPMKTISFLRGGIFLPVLTPCTFRQFQWRRFMCSQIAAHTFMTSVRTAPPIKTKSFLRGGTYLQPYGTCLLYLSSVPIMHRYPIVLIKCSKMATHTFMTSARTALPLKTMSFLRGGMYLRPYLPTEPFVCWSKADCPVQTVFPRWRLIPSWRQQERHRRWRPYPSSIVECICDPTCLLNLLSVEVTADCPDQVFQDGGSYLHDVGKNGTADEDHVLCSRRNVFATVLAYCTFRLFQ